MIFSRAANDEFDVNIVTSPDIDTIVGRALSAYRGAPEWVSDDDGIKTINFAKTICSEVAKLTTLAIGIKIDGSARATWLQGQLESSYFDIREWVEYACASGTVFVKPNGAGFDVFMPGDYVITECDKNGVTGIIFKDSYQFGKHWYTRLEYHRFADYDRGDGTKSRAYYISNRAYKSNSRDSIGERISLASTRWADLIEDTPPITKANGESLDAPMFGMLRMPDANNIDPSTPLGLPLIANAFEELRDLDTAYSRNAQEIFDSERTVLLDDQLLNASGSTARHADIKLPRYVKNVFGNGVDAFYQEIIPHLDTEKRTAYINNLLSQIGFKIGFSNGAFVFNERTGVVTATQVEADDRRTIEMVKDMRDKLEDCLNGCIYALSVYADLYGLAPVGAYEITYDFGDITYNREEDRKRWWQYVSAGKVPAWMYFVKFEGFAEDEARAMQEELSQSMQLYEEE